ncbi:hypothetical protein [Novosphingobium guangzhouense]|uniref:Uncharacterized protein n=1 Tax=Novosphingobium guangzhouense TaxID=1850347 RepID=A0A2K2FVS4_9SPHN|nr:hypothetical protein [Novosphingobium guangzhouense]PNU02872.1 hypothetical protein A8V01_07360 [Novosphingobium guangzhouense]
MILKEGDRRTLAFAGCGLWLASSLMPLFGGAAKHAVKCRGREPPAGTFDDCFIDDIPVLELGAPMLALPLLFLFGSFAMAVWSPPPWQRQRRWRLAPRWGTAAYHPNFPIACMIGAAWCLWRAALYPLEAQTLPFMAFWLVFAGWFAGAAWACRQDAKVPEDA